MSVYRGCVKMTVGASRKRALGPLSPFLKTSLSPSIRPLHTLSSVRLHLKQVSTHFCRGRSVLQIEGLPLSADEDRQLSKILKEISTNNPELARALLNQLLLKAEQGKQTDGPDRSDLHLHAMGKVANAKIAKRHGKGKTAFFSLLSDVDKTRVLELTGADGALEVAQKGKGRTAFFAAIDGTVKYESLKRWNSERQESANQDGLRSGGPGSLNLSDKRTRGELWKLFLSQGFPMIGFGFADNFLMICFGETIDAHFGLYVSTMAAAGLGNLCSNIAGLGLAEYIEHASEKMGVPAPKLTQSEKETTAARTVAFCGVTAGVTIGCLIGMLPLMFFDEEKHHRPDPTAEANS